MDRPPLVSPQHPSASQARPSRLQSAVSSPGIQPFRSSSASPPARQRPRSESRERPMSRSRNGRRDSRERSDRFRGREFESDRRRSPKFDADERGLMTVAPPIVISRHPKNGIVMTSADTSSPDSGFQEPLRSRHSDRFHTREARNRFPDSTGTLGSGSGAPITRDPYFAPKNTDYSNSNFTSVNNYAQGGRPSLLDRDEWNGGRQNPSFQPREHDRDIRSRDARPGGAVGGGGYRDHWDSRMQRDVREIIDSTSRERSDARDRDGGGSFGGGRERGGPMDKDLRGRGDVRSRDTGNRLSGAGRDWDWDTKSDRDLRETTTDIREILDREKEREREREREKERDRAAAVPPAPLARDRDRFVGSFQESRDRKPLPPPRVDRDHDGRFRDSSQSEAARSLVRAALDQDLLEYTANGSRYTPSNTGSSNVIPTEPAADRIDHRRGGGDDNRSHSSVQHSPARTDDSSSGRPRRSSAASPPFEYQHHQHRSSSPSSDRMGINGLPKRESISYSRASGQGAGTGISASGGARMDLDVRTAGGRIGELSRRPRVASAPTFVDSSRTDYFGPPRHRETDGGQGSYPNTPSMSRTMRSGFATTTAVGRDHREGNAQESLRQDGQHHQNHHDAAIVPQDSDRANSPERANRFSRSRERDISPGRANNALRIVHPVPTGPEHHDRYDRPHRHHHHHHQQQHHQQQHHQHHHLPNFQDRSPRRSGDILHTEDSATSNHLKKEEPESAILLGEKDRETTHVSPLTQTTTHPAQDAKTEPLQTTSPTLTAESDSEKAQHVVGEKEQRAAEDDNAFTPGKSELESELHPQSEPQQLAAIESEVDILQRMDKVDSEIQHLEAMLEAYRKSAAVTKVKLEEMTSPNVNHADLNEPKESTMTSAEPEHKVTMDVVGKGSPDSAAVVPVRAEVTAPIQIVAEVVPDHNHDIEMHSPPPLPPSSSGAQVFSQDTMMDDDGSSEDPFYRRRRDQQKRKPQLFDQIYAENQVIAHKYGRIHTGLGAAVKAQPDFEDQYLKVYRSIEDYPFYQENIDNHAKARSQLLKYMSAHAAALDEKELRLKREYKQHWEEWNKKVAKLDKIKERKAANSGNNSANVREEDQVMNDSGSYFSTRNRRGGFNSDAVRSEAEFLAIMESLENEDMKNPDLRASKTAATVPPMILDPWVRENVHYYDRNHLVTDPATYYRLGPVTDPWTEEEKEIFVQRYLQYPKQFGRIAAGLENKTASQCVLFYYREKKKLGFKEQLANRNKRRKGGGKRKEKAAASSGAGAGTKHKGSALIEDIGQANRTKQAKSSEVRELRSSWANVDTLELPRRRVRSTTSNQTPLDNASTTNSATGSPSLSPSATITAPTSTGKKTRSKTKANDTNVSKSATVDTQGTPNLDSPSTPIAPTTVVSARWTTEETERAFAALKIHGKNFDEMSKAVGTKTIDQCRNFLFNYKRKFGVSALDDALKAGSNSTANNGEGGSGDSGTTDKGRNKKARTTATAAAAAAAAATQSNGEATPAPIATSTRRRGAKQSPGVTQEVTSKADSIQEMPEALEATSTVTTPDTMAGGAKGRRRRTASKVETAIVNTGTTETATSTPTSTPNIAAVPASAPPTTHLSFKALYSRPPEESSGPSTPSSEPPSIREDSATPEGSIKGRATTSSYWSRQEKTDFDSLLAQHGQDWEKIAKALKTKTQVQVRNYFNSHASRRLVSAEGVSAVGSNDTVVTTPQPQEDMPSAIQTGEAEIAEEAGDERTHIAPQHYHASPPRKVTNIVSLLNSDNADIHNAAEDWFNENDEDMRQDENERSAPPPPPTYGFHDNKVTGRAVEQPQQDLESHHAPPPRRPSMQPPPLYDGPSHARTHSSSIDYGNTSNSRRPPSPNTMGGYYSPGYDGMPMSAQHRSHPHPPSDTSYSSSGTPVLGSPYAGYGSSARPASPSPHPTVSSAGPPMTHRMSSPVRDGSGSPGYYSPGHQRSSSRQLQPVAAPAPIPPSSQGYYGGSSHHAPSYSSSSFIYPPHQQQRESYPSHVRSTSDYPPPPPHGMSDRTMMPPTHHHPSGGYSSSSSSQMAGGVPASRRPSTPEMENMHLYRHSGTQGHPPSRHRGPPPPQHAMQQPSLYSPSMVARSLPPSSSAMASSSPGGGYGSPRTSNMLTSSGASGASGMGHVRRSSSPFQYPPSNRMSSPVYGPPSSSSSSQQQQQQPPSSAYPPPPPHYAPSRSPYTSHPPPSSSGYAPPPSSSLTGYPSSSHANRVSLGPQHAGMYTSHSAPPPMSHPPVSSSSSAAPHRSHQRYPSGHHLPPYAGGSGNNSMDMGGAATNVSSPSDPYPAKRLSLQPPP